MDISQKTVGFLIDELITTRIKIYVQDDLDKVRELAVRGADLVAAIDKQSELRGLGEAIECLIMADIKCFFEQEELFKFDRADKKVEAGASAIKVQRLNAERNNWMRTIDSVLGLSKFTVTDKTYK